MGALTDLVQGQWQPIGAKPQGRVRLVHGTIPGRARFAVDALRGNAAYRAVLEARLHRTPGVHEVAANLVTGHVLVLFDPQRSHRDMLHAVALAAGAALADPPPSGAAVEAPRPESRPVSDWHIRPVREVLATFDVDPRHGLPAARVAEALARHGPNALPRPARRSRLEILLGQFRSLPVALLGVSAVLSLATGGAADAAVIVGVILLNAGIGYATEIQAERTIDALNQLTRTPARVLRAGRVLEVDSEAVVPGDVLLLLPGSRVAADARLIEVRELTVDESALTGESLPVAKQSRRLPQAAVPLADRKNVVYMGTVITGGSGLAVVVATGRHTEIGAIQALVGTARPPETPLQRQLDRLGNQMVWMSGAICVLVFGIGLLRGYGGLQMLRSAISLAVAAVPEGLPTVATTTLALGIGNMRRHRVLVRHLDAVETLGAVQVICLDKTGTLTENRMRVQALFVEGHRWEVGDGGLPQLAEALQRDPDETVLRLMQVLVLCSDSELAASGKTFTVNGSATENALIHLALAAGVDAAALRARFPRSHAQYRAEGRNYMVTWHRTPDGRSLMAVKGSPAEVLALCRDRLVGGERLPLTEAERDTLLQENDRLAGEALRVLGFAFGEGDHPEGLTWLGLVGMADPLRPAVGTLIRQFHQAGIDTVMITGDQSATAHAIAKRLGLSGQRPLEILESTRLETIAPEMLRGLAQRVSVFSRVSPANKLQIVQSLQRAGKVVAMTGDGINDSPALRAADIGVAMGASGTAAARDVADVVLEDDALETMIVAVEEGRRIYGNIRKSVHFLTATNLSEIAVMLTSVAAGLGTPLNTLQLLWINLVTDIFPALALAVEPAEPDVLRRPPRHPADPIVAPSDLKRYAFESATLTAGTLAAYGLALARYGAGAQASTVAFTTLTVAQLLHTYSCRSDRHGLFTGEKLPPNRYLDAAVAGSMALQGAALFVPGLSGLLGTTRPGILDLATVGAGAVTPFLINELTKASGGKPS